MHPSIPTDADTLHLSSKPVTVQFEAAARTLEQIFLTSALCSVSTSAQVPWLNISESAPVTLTVHGFIRIIRSRIHERTIALRFRGIILRLLRFEVSVSRGDCE
jgi:hypothetical protein